jgi:hypothetical protein
MKKLTAVLLLATSFSSFADIQCIIENDNQIIIGESTLTVVTPERTVTYPKMIANKTIPEIGVITAIKGNRGRLSGTSADYSVLSMRIDSVQDDVASGSISMTGRDRSLGLDGLSVICEKEVVQLF